MTACNIFLIYYIIAFLNFLIFWFHKRIYSLFLQVPLNQLLHGLKHPYFIIFLGDLLYSLFNNLKIEKSDFLYFSFFSIMIGEHSVLSSFFPLNFFCSNFFAILKYYVFHLLKIIFYFSSLLIFIKIFE